MTEMAKLVWRKLRWRDARAFGRRYELLDKGTVAATLRFTGWFHLTAVAESSDGSWTFKRKGVLRDRIEISDTAGGKGLGVFRSRLLGGGGTLELPDGHRYIAATNFWHSRYEVTTETGQELIRYTGIWRFFRMAATVEILPGAKDLAELPWLVPLTWCVIIMRHRDAAMAAAT